MKNLAPYAAGTVIESVAVFPLRQVVLFPGALLPLHIFELRYRAMTEHVLATNRELAVAFVPEDQRDQPVPQFASISGIGEVIDHERLADGRFNILVRGRARAALEELDFVPPYRRARAKILGGTNGGVHPAQLTALVYGAAQFAARVRRRDAGFQFTIPPAKDPALLADLCANYLVIDGEQRQELLEMLPVADRVRRCMQLLAVQEAMLSERGPLQ